MTRKFFMICLLLLLVNNNLFCQSQGLVPDSNKRICENDSVMEAKKEVVISTHEEEVKQTKETKDGNFWGVTFALLTLLLAALTLLISYVVYGVQQQTRRSSDFQDCSKSLKSNNEIEQSAAAILLRGFMKKQRVGLFFNVDYSREAKDLLAGALQKPIPYSLQKNIADGFSFASNLDGQDMQRVIMINALIKPESRIKYELTGKEKYKKERLSMKKADFYQSVVMDCSINNVDATGVFFIYTILSGTSFRNCILKKASFDSANVDRVKFDADCVLDGASFNNAIGLETAVVRRRVMEIVEKDGKCFEQEVEQKHYLIDCLDEYGVFDLNKTTSYSPPHTKYRIFLSKMGIMTPLQQTRFEMIKDILEKRDNIEIVKIERNNYLNAAQLKDVETHLEYCDGCVIFAFEYLKVNSGVIHNEVESEDQHGVENVVFASPWLHIETALANEKHIPCLIIFENNLCRDGMFDESVTKSDYKLETMPYTDDKKKIDESVKKWMGGVIEYHETKQRSQNTVLGRIASEIKHLDKAIAECGVELDDSDECLQKVMSMISVDSGVSELVKERITLQIGKS